MTCVPTLLCCSLSSWHSSDFSDVVLRVADATHLFVDDRVVTHRHALLSLRDKALFLSVEDNTVC
jgi:hypothetical protein